ncbi:hypothetical protein BPUM_04140 [Bacillus pumilus SAFR-032]|uniref:Uncharacterized protein n=1 Tax=Bacillus pumilus (strain SAFR-032) TaxID=315750 RepID=A0A0U2MU39_BACP2|nr:hypothetical protein BPUM_04140 [Bacillus pumilus SAFR-032]
MTGRSFFEIINEEIKDSLKQSREAEKDNGSICARVCTNERPSLPFAEGAFYLSKRGVKDGTKSSHS